MDSQSSMDAAIVQDLGLAGVRVKNRPGLPTGNGGGW